MEENNLENLENLEQLRRQIIERWESSGLLNGIVGGHQRNNLFGSNIFVPKQTNTIPTPDEIKNYLIENNLKSPDNQTVTK